MTLLALWLVASLLLGVLWAVLGRCSHASAADEYLLDEGARDCAGEAPLEPVNSTRDLR